jgi:hypothetical protein
VEGLLGCALWLLNLFASLVFEFMAAVACICLSRSMRTWTSLCYYGGRNLVESQRESVDWNFQDISSLLQDLAFSFRVCASSGRQLNVSVATAVSLQLLCGLKSQDNQQVGLKTGTIVGKAGINQSGQVGCESVNWKDGVVGQVRTSSTVVITLNFQSVTG